tara:strand:+ start:1008 stop:1340 length:333 start_codon:yes stop_codon:yes gene_type:complete
MSSSNEKKLRQEIEGRKDKSILGAEKIHIKDSFHYLRAGLDQITLKIAKKKKKTIGFSFENLRNTKGAINQAKLLARMQQNMQLCQKYHVQTKISAKIETGAFRRLLQKR